jgi:hypothetical protein
MIGRTTIHERFYGTKQTIGKWTMPDGSVYYTVEKVWANNKRNVSCIKEDIYELEKMLPTEKYPEGYFRVKNVEGRSGVLIHNANYERQLRGCIAPGLTLRDIDGDGLRDAINSKKAMAQIYSKLETGDKIHIKGGWNGKV